MNTLNVIPNENASEENIDITEAKNSPLYSLDEGLRIARILQYPLMLKHPTLTSDHQPMIIYHQTEFVEYLNHSPISQSTPLLLERLNTDTLSEQPDDFKKRKALIKEHCRKIALELARLS